MTLSQTNLRNRDIAEAVHEVLNNIGLLYMGGYFHEALEILQHLVKSKAWELSKYSYQKEEIEKLWPLLHWAYGEACQAYLEVPERSVRALNTWQKRVLRFTLGNLLNFDLNDNLRTPVTELGTNWHEGFVETLPTEYTGIFLEPGTFVFHEIRYILIMRLQKRIKIRRIYIEPGTLEKFPINMRLLAVPVLLYLKISDNVHKSRIKVRESDFVVNCNTQALEALLLAALARKNDTRRLARLDDTYMLMIMDYLLDDRPELATRLYAKVLAQGFEITEMKYLMIWTWEPLKAYFESGQLRNVLELDERTVNEYIEAVKSRSLDNLDPEPNPLDFDWVAAIEEYKERLKKYAEPYEPNFYLRSSGLDTINARGEIVSEYGASDEQIISVEKRLGITLPSSYKNFLKTTNGMILPDFPFDLLPVEDIGLFMDLKPDWLQIDINDQDRVDIPDDLYYIYGRDQEDFNYNKTDLLTALQITSMPEDQVLLLNPNVRFGEECEVWSFYSHQGFGADRFKSFASMMESFFLEDDE